MKRYLAILLVTTFAVSSAQQASAQLSINVGNKYNEYLDLQAVATAFSQSRTISDFEYTLNDNRNRISNLDLNNDGFIDYLRVEQYSDYEEHVIEVQAILGRNYHQTVATLYIWRDRYNNEQIQIVGNETIYGRNYIIVPVFRRRPVIVRWLWDFRSPRYVSPYYWGHYPRQYKVRHIVALPAYRNHIKSYVDHRHRYNRTEHNNRPVTRDNRGNVYRGNENRTNSSSSGYNEGNRKSTNQPSVNTRNNPKPTVINRNDRQKENNQRVEPVKKNDTRREVNKKESDKRNATRSERVRDARPEPSKSTPAPARSSESSTRKGSDTNSKTSSGRR